MDKQKQIEEIAKAMGGCDYPHRHCEKCWCKEKYECGAYACAKTLAKKGYRKIPENALLILDEEMEDFADMIVKSPQMQKTMSRLIKAWEKETAEKFAEKLKAKLQEWLDDNEDNNFKINKGIAMIELIGVKTLEGEVIVQGLIDEICKEIIGE